MSALLPTHRARHAGITVADIAGMTPDGQIPPRLGDECRLALAHANRALAAAGYSLHDCTHIVCLVRDMDGFPLCTPMIAEALGPARPTITLRRVMTLPNVGQRIAFTARALHSAQ